MNRRAGTEIGQIITSVPALILVFVIMLVFVVVSGFLANGLSSSANILDTYLSTSVIFEGKSIPVNEAFNMLCKDKSLSNRLGIALRNDFRDLFEGKHSFAFVDRYNGGVGGYGSVLYSWFGAFQDKYSENQLKVNRFDFAKVFDKEFTEVKYKEFCDNFIFYIKEDKL